MNKISNIGELIHAELEKQKISQAELSRRLGVSQPAVSYYIYDQLPIYQMLPLASALGIATEWIIKAMVEDYAAYLFSWAESKRKLMPEFKETKKSKKKSDQNELTNF